ncbi:MarR family winged helix-turn-helix transcriptional regulator [Chryseomicrobium aureum]|uniref:MarR family winged helix-turn-helix transcriptional regulator n=1 Tax=Chryseomicrobium aureum TaxID=1441723 RepID=UPI0019575910|nr:MarR family transcriptional regulator [Chryseomicrobium aureum]MBM7707475.1 DNA-binding MarR family transcriptional regulator [Chryseomicrobium aureum]
MVKMKKKRKKIKNQILTTMQQASSLEIQEQFQRVTLEWSRAMEAAFADHSITFTQFNALRKIKEHQPLHQQQLSDLLSVTKGNVSQMITRLEKVGLVQTEKSGNLKLLSLTSKGEEEVSRLNDTAVSADKEFLTCWTPEEQQVLNGLVKKALS